MLNYVWVFVPILLVASMTMANRRYNQHFLRRAILVIICDEVQRTGGIESCFVYDRLADQFMPESYQEAVSWLVAHDYVHRVGSWLLLTKRGEEQAKSLVDSTDFVPLAYVQRFRRSELARAYRLATADERRQERERWGFDVD